MRRGITLIEVLVVLVIVAVLGAMAVLFIARQRASGLRLQCMNNLRRIGVATHTYHDTSGGEAASRTLPPARLADGYATWAVLVGPHLDAEHALQQWDVSKRYAEQGAKVREAIQPAYFCPARPRTSWLSIAGDTDADEAHVPGAVGDYACVAGTGSADRPWTGPNADGPMVLADAEVKDGRIVRWRGRTSLASLERGLAYTLLVGEKHVPPDGLGQAEFGDASLYNGQHPASFSRVAGPGFGVAPAVDAPFNRNFGGPHPGVCQFLMADGGVRSFAVTVEDTVLGRMATRSQ